ncbi:beta-1,6-N-acetylglucosaminyltransferase [Liquorilactobacillus satsumensis]|uniref:beta-1,6-N-acetylglucosaminyltransferase n=1 Tax=Liquorilactobacillus satsumensis TaxID=259059 RepID=UPI0039EACFF0
MLNSKHAYLIMASGNIPQLKILLSVLDDPRNDLYLHLDLKATGFVEKELAACCSFATLYFQPREKITWGASSQAMMEMKLLKAATPRQYSYYHLLSGLDLPLKDQDYLHAFFARNAGQEFVECSDYQRDHDKTRYYLRFQQYHLLQQFIGKKKNLLKYLDFGSCFLQKTLGINRTQKSKMTFKSGANWFSISNDFAQYLMTQFEPIMHFLKFTYCADEVFLATWLYNSKFSKNIYPAQGIYQANLRIYRWENHNPSYVTLKEAQDYVASPFLFARKFDLSKNEDAITYLRTHLSTRNKL